MICCAGVSLEPSKKPLNLLIKKINNDITIRLKNDIQYRGKMIDCDSQMNVILEGKEKERTSIPMTIMT